MRQGFKSACLIGVAATFAVVPPPGTAGLRHVKSLSIETLRSKSPGPLLVPLRDRVIARPSTELKRSIRLFDYSGVYYTTDGLPITVSVSDSYQPNPSAAQSYATFFGSLLHGAELANLTVYVKTPAEVSVTCGPSALACYITDVGMVIAGEDVPGQPPTEEIAVHEYGHRIAAFRTDAPFPAFTFGPKYWSTYMNVCDLTRRGLLFPGDEAANYSKNPGEGWAEAYRVWNEIHFGWAPLPLIVDSYFNPDVNAQATVENDVLRPWTGNTIIRKAGVLKRNQVRIWRLRPYDGWMTASISGNARVGILNTHGKVLKFGRSVRYLVCGDDWPMTVGVVGLGRTRFSLVVAYP